MTLSYYMARPQIPRGEKGLHFLARYQLTRETHLPFLHPLCARLSMI